MAIKQTKAIQRLYDETLKNGITVEEKEDLLDIIRKCEEKGQFIFHPSTTGDSYWSFVKTTLNGSDCIRMVFALKAGESGKVQDIERVMTLIKNLESTLIFIDDVKMIKGQGFIYLDAFKKL